MKGDESTIIIEVNEYLDLYSDLGFPSPQRKMVGTSINLAL
jgi:hypothetical protein